jgi:hypothetical protein
MSGFSLALDIALLVLLAATVFYCWRLDRRLDTLKKGQDGLRDAASEMVDSIARAETAVRGLRAASEDAKRELQARIDEARGLADRLDGDRGGVGPGRGGRTVEFPPIRGRQG